MLQTLQWHFGGLNCNRRNVQRKACAALWMDVVLKLFSGRMSPLAVTSLNTF